MVKRRNQGKVENSMYRNYLSFSSNRLDFNAPLFIPVGSVEIHGNALPLGTDTFIAMAFAEKFADKVGGIIIPPIYFGICPSTGRFRETISVTHEGFILYLKNILRGLIENKFKRIVIINIHDGNHAAIKSVVESTFMEKEYPVYYINPYNFMKDELDQKLFNGKDNSYKEACLLFASLKVLGLKESKMNIDKANRDSNVNRPEELNILRRYGWVGFTYYKEEQHVGVRKDVDVSLGLQYLESAANKIPELMENLNKHVKRLNMLK